MATEQASLGIDLQEGSSFPATQPPIEDITAAELSTASLDGAKIVDKSRISGSGIAADGTAIGDNHPLAAENQSLLKATAALSSEPATETPKPKASRYFIQPASGHNWGVLHNHNGVDIANSCGTPVLAAAAGVVIADPSLGSGLSGWNGGYGEFLLIEHSNGTKTRYAHLSKIEVSIGENVEQGQEIGRIGNTGHVEGQTGCHLHFEVIGGANPFAR